MLRRTLLLSPVLFLCFAFSLFADGTLTFVVPASRDSKDIMDAPAQMTVITFDKIQVSGKRSLVQILNDVACVLFISYLSEADARPFRTNPPPAGRLP